MPRAVSPSSISRGCTSRAKATTPLAELAAAVTSLVSWAIGGGLESVALHRLYLREWHIRGTVMP